MTDSQAKKTAGAPWHLWLIGILGFLWSAIGTLNYVLTQTKNEALMSTLTPEQIAFCDSLPVWVITTWGIAVWGGVIGALLLLFRRRLAVLVFLVSLLGLIATTIHNFLLSNGMEVMGGAGNLIFTAVIFLFSLGLYLYARAMGNRSVLA